MLDVLTGKVHRSSDGMSLAHELQHIAATVWCESAIIDVLRYTYIIIFEGKAYVTYLKAKQTKLMSMQVISSK